MRSLIILLFLSVARGVEIPLKNGIVNVDVSNNGHLIIVNLTKNGENNITIFYVLHVVLLNEFFY